MREDNVSCEQLRPLLEQASARDLTADEQLHLASCNDCADALLTQLLQSRPRVLVPEDFATRLTASLPADRAIAPRRRPAYGRNMAYAALASLVMAIGLLALVDPRWFVANSALWLTLETFAAFEAGALAFWLGRHEGSS